jgi:hypothetical protein
MWLPESGPVEITRFIRIYDGAPRAAETNAMPGRDILHGGGLEGGRAGSADKDYKESMHAGKTAQVETCPARFKSISSWPSGLHEPR